MADLAQIEQELGRPLDDTFRDVASGLESVTEEQVVELLAAWQAGRVTDEELEQLLAVLLATAVGAGLAYGDIIGSGYVGRDPVGLVPDEATVTRLSLAASTTRSLLDVATDPAPRVRRVAVGEALAALQEGVVKSYDSHGVSGYRRGLSGRACELCHWLYKDGYVYPTSKPMHRHPGCTCVPVPVTANND